MIQTKNENIQRKKVYRKINLYEHIKPFYLHFLFQTNLYISNDNYYHKQTVCFFKDPHTKKDRQLLIIHLSYI